MCGLFGFVASPRSDKGPDLGRLREIALHTETRGGHAFGLAWVDARGTTRMFRQLGPIGDDLGVLRLLKGARMLIGHCRWASRGAADDIANAHPWPFNGGWYVHNGTIRDYDDLAVEYDFRPQSECDSEAFGLIAETFHGTDAERLAMAVRATRRRDQHAVLGLWGRPRSLVAIRRGKPLHRGQRGGANYLASLPGGLPEGASLLACGSVLTFTPQGVRESSIPSHVPAPKRRPQPARDKPAPLIDDLLDGPADDEGPPASQADRPDLDPTDPRGIRSLFRDWPRWE